MIEYAVVNPATGETVARYDSFTDAHVEQTLGMAETGFETWRKLPVAERAGRSAGRPSCIGNVARNWPPSSSGRWAR